MKDFKWNIVYISQMLVIVAISGVLLFKMGVFEDVKNAMVPEVVAENVDENILDLEENKIAVSSEQLENIIEEVKEEVVEIKKDDYSFEKISAEELQAIIDKYKDQTKRMYTTTLTSYNSEPGQTDDSPCITASNLDVCERDFEDIVATNDLPFHTKIMIPEYFGERIFYVEDRMNRRYTGTGRIDIWLKSKANSKKWGIRQAKIIILK